MPADLDAVEMVKRLDAAIELGDRTGSRGKRPENIYNVASDARTLIASLAEENARLTREKAAALGLVEGHSAIIVSLEAALAKAVVGEVVCVDDARLLMQIERDNRHDGARLVVSQGETFDRAFCLSNQGFIALEQIASGVRLHITRLGVAAISRFCATPGKAGEERA